MIANLDGDKVAQWNYVKHPKGCLITAVFFEGKFMLTGKGRTLNDAMNDVKNQLPSDWSLSITPQDNRVES
jgi:hypothetical protein